MRGSNLFIMDRDAVEVTSAVLLGLLRNSDKVHFAKQILVFFFIMQVICSACIL